MISALTTATTRSMVTVSARARVAAPSAAAIASVVSAENLVREETRFIGGFLWCFLRGLLGGACSGDVIRASRAEKGCRAGGRLARGAYSVGGAAGAAGGCTMRCEPGGTVGDTGEA